MTEDEMVGWHHRLNGHDFEEALGNGESQGRLVCCSPWGRKESDATYQLKNKNIPGVRNPLISQMLQFSSVQLLSRVQLFVTP